MSIAKVWISAFRLRTLPLATAAVLMGMVLADNQYRPDLGITFLCLLTAIFLQVLSNLANDYGDFVKGTDNDQRIGNMRALQSGKVSVKAMRNAIILFVILSLASGITLLCMAGGGQIDWRSTGLFIVGIAAIAAAIKYTVGKYAYGYSGWGDVFVFLFFGPVAVIGTFLLNTGYRFDMGNDLKIIYPALGVGLLCAAVLNVNNIRDIENDKANGKLTIPVKLGLTNARRYHAFLVITALLLIDVYAYLQYNFIVLALLWPNYRIIQSLVLVYRTAPSPAYNMILKKLSLATLLLVFIYWISGLVAKVYFMAQAWDYLSK